MYIYTCICICIYVHIYIYIYVYTLRDSHPSDPTPSLHPEKTSAPDAPPSPDAHRRPAMFLHWEPNAGATRDCKRVAVAEHAHHFRKLQTDRWQ